MRQNVFEEVKKQFIDYLDRKKQRKTPERFTILEEIYQRSDHFDVEALYDSLKSNRFRISKATVYNTLDLLLEAGLVVRHQFGNSTARYEKSYGYRQHDHLICNACERVFEFCDPRLGVVSGTMGELLHFNVVKHSLTLYADPQLDPKGLCIACNMAPAQAAASL